MVKKTYFKDSFVFATVTCPHRRPVRTLISNEKRNVEVLDGPNESKVVRWWYEDAEYEEDYQLILPSLDSGAIPLPDGTGVVSGGFPVQLYFYEPAR